MCWRIDDHTRRDLDLNDVTPVFSRIRLRGYVETNERAVVELRNAGFSALNILLWVTVLHKIHSRQAAASIVANVVANKLPACPVIVAAVADLLHENFSDNDLQWELKSRFVGGAAYVERLVGIWGHVIKFCVKLAALDPQQWTISRQHALLCGSMDLVGLRQHPPTLP